MEYNHSHAFSNDDDSWNWHTKLIVESLDEGTQDNINSQLIGSGGFWPNGTMKKPYGRK